MPISHGSSYLHIDIFDAVPGVELFNGRSVLLCKPGKRVSAFNRIILLCGTRRAINNFLHLIISGTEFLLPGIPITVFFPYKWT